MSDTGKESQKQQDLKPRFIALNLDVLSHDGKLGAFASQRTVEPTHGGNLPGIWAQVCAHRTPRVVCKISQCELLSQCVEQTLGRLFNAPIRVSHGGWNSHASWHLEGSCAQQ